MASIFRVRDSEFSCFAARTNLKTDGEEIVLRRYVYCRVTDRQDGGHIVGGLLEEPHGLVISPKNVILHSHRRENRKSCLILTGWSP
jgi:hypothetical protein